MKIEGIWKLDSDGEIRAYSEDGDLLDNVAMLYNDEAANLIAAAPDLYDALACFANARVDAITGTIVLGNVGAPEAVKIAQRALRKARGEQSL